jgi:anti-sigma factor RsiW
MTCEETLALVEPIVAGDVPVSESVRAHIETCPGCARALATAQRIDLALRGLPAPTAPPGFTAAVTARIRRERWVTEQRVDRLFNLGIAAAVLLLVAAVVSVANVSGVLAAADWTAVQLAALGSRAARQAAPAAGLYLAAAGLLVTALGMWWWAERGAWL